MSEEGFKLSDILYAIVIPCVVAALIIIFPVHLRPALDPTLQAILVDAFAETILIVAIPMLFGLLWNRWAGGATGFLLGSLYALYVNDTYVALGFYDQMAMEGLVGEISNMGYILCGMLTGYVAGALAKGVYNLRRMLAAGVTSGIIGGLFLMYTQFISPVGMTTDIPWVTFVTLTPRIVFGIVVPLVAMFFVWYDITPKGT